jgi:hypothetical protein
VVTPNTGVISSRKLSSQFVKSAQVSSGKQGYNYALPPGPYTHSLNATIEQESQNIASKKNKYQLHSSKMVLEPLSNSNSANNGLLSKPDSATAGVKQRSLKQSTKNIKSG